MYQNNEYGRPSISKNSDTSNQNIINNDQLNRQSNDFIKQNIFDRPSNEFSNNFLFTEKFSLEQRESNGMNSFFNKNSPGFPLSGRPSLQQQQQQQQQQNQYIYQQQSGGQQRFSFNESFQYGQDDNRDSLEFIFYQQNNENNEQMINQAANRPSVIPRFSHQNQSNAEQDQLVIQEINKTKPERDSQANGISFQSFRYDSNPPPPILKTSSSQASNNPKKDQDDDDLDDDEKKEAVQGCNCKKSKCLKLYCECFQQMKDCGPHCKCVDCNNVPSFLQEQCQARKYILQKNPDAFTSKIGVIGNMEEDVEQILPESFENINLQANNNKFQVESNQLINNRIVESSNTSNDTNSDKHLILQQQQFDAKNTVKFAYKKGCNCKKTNCLKKYCECYNNGVKCSYLCKCEGCSNVNDNAMQIQMQEVQQQQQQPQQYQVQNQYQLYPENNIFYQQNYNQQEILSNNRQNLFQYEQQYTKRKRAKTVMDIEEDQNMERKRHSIKMAELGIEEN